MWPPALLTGAGGFWFFQSMTIGPAMSRAIDYYFSLVSPWAYIGHRHFLDIARRHAARVVYKPVQLNEVFAQTGGLPLARRHPARQAYRMMDLQRWREKRGLAFHLRPQHWPFDADLANCAVEALAASGADPADFVQRAFAGVWEAQRDLADRAVVAELLRAAGLSPDSILAQVDSESIRGSYERNRLDAIATGVFGSPAYVLDGEIFWGQDRLDLLDDALTSGRPPFTAQN
jgi:2-hydroxychromene-2-carboxylate isomerase